MRVLVDVGSISACSLPCSMPRSLSTSASSFSAAAARAAAVPSPPPGSCDAGGGSGAAAAPSRTGPPPDVGLLTPPPLPLALPLRDSTGPPGCVLACGDSERALLPAARAAAAAVGTGPPLLRGLPGALVVEPELSGREEGARPRELAVPGREEASCMEARRSLDLGLRGEQAGRHGVDGC